MIESVVFVTICVPDPDVIDDGSSFALCSLWVSYQVIPGTKYSPTERKILIGGTGQTQARVLGHSVGHIREDLKIGSNSPKVKHYYSIKTLKYWVWRAKKKNYFRNRMMKL